MKKQLIYGASIIGLIVCLILVSIVSNQVIVKQNSKPEIIMLDTEEIEGSIGSIISYTDDVLQITVLDSLAQENSTIHYNANDKTKPIEYYALRKVKLLTDSLNGLKKGTQLVIREQAARSDQNQIFQIKGRRVLEKEKKYSVMVKCDADGINPVIILNKHALQPYTQSKGSDADDTLAFLVHALYAESRLDKTQIKAIATSQKLAGTFDSVLEMKPYPFTNLNDKADQFVYAYSSEVDTTYIEYRNNMYKVSGNVMNME